MPGEPIWPSGHHLLSGGAIHGRLVFFGESVGFFYVKMEVTQHDQRRTVSVNSKPVKEHTWLPFMVARR